MADESVIGAIRCKCNANITSPSEQKARVESATMDKLDAIIDNIFDLSSLEEIDKFLDMDK